MSRMMLWQEIPTTWKSCRIPLSPQILLLMVVVEFCEKMSTDQEEMNKLRFNMNKQVFQDCFRSCS